MTREQVEELLRNREYVDWGETPFVSCDTPCFALREPTTTEEIKAAYEHWRDHGYLHGCSHGC